MRSDYFGSVELPVEALGFYAHARACQVADAEQFARTVLEIRPQNVLAEDVFEWLYETEQPTPQLFRAMFGPEQKCAFCDAPTRTQCAHQIAHGALCELPICASCEVNGKCRIHKNSEVSLRPVSAGVLISILRTLADAVARYRKEQRQRAAPEAVNYCKATYNTDLLRPVFIREECALKFVNLLGRDGAVKSLERVPNSQLPELHSVGSTFGIEIYMETAQ